MAGGATIKVEGLEALRKKFKQIPQKVVKELDEEMFSISEEYVDAAQLDAPKDVGALTEGITATHELLNHAVVSHAPYSAYIEFGTKSRFKAIPGIDASKYMGKGKGDYYDFLNNILDWVKRKGLHHVTNSYTGKKVGGKAAKENLLVLAEAIAFSIIKKGVHPHPFFFKQLPIAQAKLNKGSKEVIQKALK